LREHCGITQRFEHRPAEGIAKVYSTFDSIVEAEAEAMIAEVANVDDMRQIEHH
jgi:hypothetical protein